MFSEYEDTLNQFLKILGKTNPDEFTQREWDLIWAYTKSDGCTGVADIHVKACWEHDFYFRTHHDFEGKVVSFWEANKRFRRRIQCLSKLGILSPVSWERWLGVTMLGKSAWEGKKRFRL